MRPITAFFSAMSAGLIENFTGKSYIESGDIVVDRTCVVDACCDGIGCDPGFMPDITLFWRGFGLE